MAFFTFAPKDGGQLLSRLSSGNLSPSNYSAKYNWRRDLDVEHRREGWDYFYPQTQRGIGSQPFPADPGEEITLVHLARRPDGTVAVLAGTPTRLWVYRGHLDPLYVEKKNGEEYVQPIGPDDEDRYWEESFKEWQLIGEGFKTYAEGAQRWEAQNLNGYTVLNNGADPVMTYRIEEDSVKVIDELLMQGIVRARTIAEYYGFLFIGNLTESSDPTLLEPTRSTIPVFQLGAISSQEPGRFDEKPVELTLTSTVGGPMNFTASMEFFRPEDVGRWIVPGNGRFFKLLSITDSLHARCEERMQDSVAAPLVDPFTETTVIPFFFLTDARDDTSRPTSAYYATTDKDLFVDPKTQWEGKRMSWSDGTTKTIVKVVNAKTALMDDDRPVDASKVAIENTTIRDLEVNPNVALDVRPFRVAWSLPMEPRRWGLTMDVTFTAGETSLATTNDATHGFTAGQEVAVQGAGEDGGVLTAFVEETGPGFIRLDRPVESTGEGIIVAADALASATGYEDLQDDGSGVLRMLRLNDALVIYKDTTNYICTYTGNVEQPMRFLLVPMPHGSTLHYRWTLVEMDGNYHVYAGRNSFYSFDLTTRRPVPIDPIDLLQDLFFNRVSLADTNQIFATDNYITKEIFIVVPKPRTPLERVICFDYRYRTFATSDMPLTAGATVIRPDKRQEVGETQHWFVMGNHNGTLLLYGMMRGEYNKWMPPPPYVTTIFYRRDARPLPSGDAGLEAARYGYQSRIITGKNAFGDDFNEKDVINYVLHLSGIHDISTKPVEMTVTFSGSRNASEPVTLLGTRVLDDACRISLIPTWFRVHNIREEIFVDGMDNPIRMQGRTYELAAYDTKSTLRGLP